MFLNIILKGKFSLLVSCCSYLLSLFIFQAVVRAMDTVTDFVKKMNSTVDIQKYIVAGASKVHDS